jgi:hypothetical protein
MTDRKIEQTDSSTVPTDRRPDRQTDFQIWSASDGSTGGADGDAAAAAAAAFARFDKDL